MWWSGDKGLVSSGWCNAVGHTKVWTQSGLVHQPRRNGALHLLQRCGSHRSPNPRPRIAESEKANPIQREKKNGSNGDDCEYDQNSISIGPLSRIGLVQMGSGEPYKMCFNYLQWPHWEVHVECDGSNEPAGFRLAIPQDPKDPTHWAVQDLRNGSSPIDPIGPDITMGPVVGPTTLPSGRKHGRSSLRIARERSICMHLRAPLLRLMEVVPIWNRFNEAISMLLQGRVWLGRLHLGKAKWCKVK